MNEQEWLLSSTPAAMLEHLQWEPTAQMYGSGFRRRNPPIATDRKLRLFACACWELNESDNPVFDQKIHQELREIAYPFAEGEISLEKSINELHKTIHHTNWLLLGSSSVDIALEYCHRLQHKEHIICLLLRLIFGNPFRPVEYRHDWARERDILAIAQACYDLRDAAYFVPLWDALEEAGCTSEEIRRALAWEQRCGKCLGLKFVSDEGDIESHIPFEECVDKCDNCSGTGWLPIPGEPVCVRGAWFIDLILGKS